MAEFIVSMFALLPFFIIIPFLAQYIDAAQVTTASTRFAGFERTYYHDNKCGFWFQCTEEEMEDLNEKINEFYVENTGLDFELTAINKYEKQGNGLVDPDMRTIENIPHRMYYAASFGLQTQGYRITEVNAELDLPTWEALTNGPTQISRYIVLPTDDWNANGPDDVKRRVQLPGAHIPRPELEMSDGSFLQTGLIAHLTTENVGSGVPIVSILNAVPDNNFSVGDLWEFDPELVPADRLN